MRRGVAAVVELLSSFGHDNNPAGERSGEMTAACRGRFALSAILAMTLGACTLPSPGVVKASPSITAAAAAGPPPPRITPPPKPLPPRPTTVSSSTTHPPPDVTRPSPPAAPAFATQVPDPDAHE